MEERGRTGEQTTGLRQLETTSEGTQRPTVSEKFYHTISPKILKSSITTNHRKIAKSNFVQLDYEAEPGISEMDLKKQVNICDNMFPMYINALVNKAKVQIILKKKNKFDS